MLQPLAKPCLAALLVGLLAVHLPALAAALFEPAPESVHLLHSPVLDAFVWKEKVAVVPPEAAAKNEDHHQDFVYRDEHGTYYSRVEFERLLPFIYYKNMELWGLLPIALHGRSFDAGSIRDDRRVMELPAAGLRARGPDRALVPLLESASDAARLVFPEDRYRLAPDGLQFINADTNQEDQDLSREFTQALRRAGFVFPARLTAGRHTILKPYDAGHMLVDANGAVFHLRRARGRPVAVRTPIPPERDTRFIEIIESARRDHLGLLLDGRGGLHVLDADYTLHALSLPGYDPARMDFRLILDPLFATAVYGDAAAIHGVAMDRAFTPLRRHSHDIVPAVPATLRIAMDIAFPFRLAPASLPGDGPAWRAGSAWSLLGMLASVAALAAIRHVRGQGAGGLAGLALAACCGVYGLAAALLVLED